MGGFSLWKNWQAVRRLRRWHFFLQLQNCATATASIEHPLWGMRQNGSGDYDGDGKEKKIWCAYLTFLQITNFMFDSHKNLSNWWIINNLGRINGRGLLFFYFCTNWSRRHPSLATTETRMLLMVNLERESKFFVFQ